MTRKKKRLSEQQEFELLKLTLDKILWLGVAIMLFGLYRAFTDSGTIAYGLLAIVAGSVVLFLYVWVLTKYFEIIR